MLSEYLIKYSQQGSLYRKLQITQTISPLRDRLKWALEIMEGIENLHMKGLVHGDINIGRLQLKSPHVLSIGEIFS